MAKNKSMNGINIFMKYIYDKEQFKLSNLFRYLSHKMRLNKFIRDIENGSPSFNILWQMADFIKLAETIFFYKNTQKDSGLGLYSSRNYASGTNGFRLSDLNDEGGLKVTIKLFNESKQVLLEIEYLKTDNPKQIMTFTDNDWDTAPTAYDEMLLDQIIKIINHRIINLFYSCYDKR